MNLPISEDKLNAIAEISRKLLSGISFCNLYTNELFDNYNTLIFWKDSNCNYLACNKKFAEIGGIVSPLAICGKNDYQLVWRKEQSDKYTTDDLSVMRLACPQVNVVETMLKADGKESVVLTSKFPIFSYDKKKSGILGLVTIITDKALLK